MTEAGCMHPNSFTSVKGLVVLRDAFKSLPSHAAMDLLARGMCFRCVLRLFGTQDHLLCTYSMSTSTLHSVVREEFAGLIAEDNVSFEASKGLSNMFHEASIQLGYCRICLGILQFRCCFGNDILSEMDDFSESIANMLKKEGYQMDNFSLEVSIPNSIRDRELAIWLYVKRKYQSEDWFRDKICNQISVKDALKLAVIDALEKRLDTKCGEGSVRVRLTFAQPNCETKANGVLKVKEDSKRRKTDVGAVLTTEISCDGLQSIGLSEHLLDLPTEVNQPCNLILECYRMPVFIGGRYLKYSRNVSQTRWVIDDERMGEASVEEIICDTILPICPGSVCKFHAAGREDIDVRMLGSGRPFLIQIQNARHVPTVAFIQEIEKRINYLENNLVKVKNLRLVGSEGWEMMREGEAEKQKQYAALVWISRPLNSEDKNAISSQKDMKIFQRTPIRVLHRRSPLEREKTIHWMDIEGIGEHSQYFILHLCTQAGTYIKEFVHGDLGRTYPSIGSMLGCCAEILQLDVTDVKMNCFSD